MILNIKNKYIRRTLAVLWLLMAFIILNFTIVNISLTALAIKISGVGNPDFDSVDEIIYAAKEIQHTVQFLWKG